MSASMGLAWALIVWGHSPHAGLSSATNAQETTAPTAPELLSRIARDLPATAAASRALLLGRRDPRQGSCVPDLTTLNASGVPMAYANPEGGPGSTLPYLMLSARFTSHRQVYDWQQTVLRAWLGDLRSRNAQPLRGAEQFHSDARALAEALADRTTWPAGLAPVPPAAGDHWPAECLRRLNAAIAARDLPACRRWAEELASAAFALADLHRWVDFVAGNGQSWLDFQTRCQTLFDWTDDVFRICRYPMEGTDYLDRLPGTTLVTPTIDNLREVERQAERLFQVLPAFVQAAEAHAAPPGAIAMPPDLRETYGYIREKLPAGDQATWDRAAASPFHRSYLANMLYRAARAKVVPELALSLRRLGQELERPASVEELMSVAFSRGGEICGALVWGDRYDSRLIEGGGEIDGDNERALLQAHALTHQFLGRWENYAGAVWTLQQALDERKLDCVRGTDMIGSLYRNAGNAGYRLVRLMWGLAGHSISGCLTTHDGRPAVRLVDSLVQPGEHDVWPSAFFHGHDWPEGYPGPRGPLFAAELCARGLDNYVLAEGYVIRGPHAGTLLRTAIPYQPGYRKGATEKVYAGPYPKLPPASSSLGLDAQGRPRSLLVN